MPVKDLVTEVDLKQLLQADFGEILTATISLNPQQFSEKLYKSSEICPICGKTTLGVERLSAILNPKFNTGLAIVYGVWLHPLCFRDCPDSDEPAPIPW